MRVLMTTDTVGGVWTFTQELATGLLQWGWSVLLMSFGRLPSESQQRACDGLQQRFGSAFRFVPTSIPLEWMDHNESAFSAGAELLQREAARFSPDILHTNQFCYGAVAVSVPRIVTAHSDVLSWVRACRNEPLPATPWLDRYTQMVQAGLESADAVVAPTQWMLQALGEGFDLPAHQFVIPNGRSMDASAREPRTMQAVTAGRLWDEAKDVRILEQVDSPIPLFVAGETREQLASVGKAKLLGALSQQQIMRLFESSAIYICTSRYEPFGLAPLEAALCGCAVLARDIASLREVWQDAAVYFEDAGQLTALLRQISQSPNLLSGLQAKASARARHFTQEQTTTQYIDLFTRIAENALKVQHAD